MALVLLVTLFLAVAATPAPRALPVTYGPRPYWLVDALSDGPLKRRLSSCARQRARRTGFSIGHRGAPLQFPEHTKESYIAAARMGAGILECDVTFTKDLELVCRHSQCDLHTTTDILLTPLASKCAQPFAPAVDGKPASARCCTSDITLAEFRTLRGKMDASFPSAKSATEYVTRGTPAWRTDLYATAGTLLTHAESIALFRALGANFAPELKAPAVEMPFRGVFTQAMYAQKLVDEYVLANVPAAHIWLQSFSLDDVRYWVRRAPAFGRQAVYLDGRYAVDGFDPTRPGTISPSFGDIRREGVRVIAPPMWVLLRARGNEVVPSAYARAAKRAGLDVITWTLERSGAPPSGFYLQSFQGVVKSDGDILKALHVLATEVRVLGIFTDWPATVTYYANCFGL